MQRDEPRVIDAAYEVIEPRYPWRFRFWPSVLWWVGAVALTGSAVRHIPTSEAGYVPLYVFGAAMLSPIIRLLFALLTASGERVDERPAQILRQRLSRRAG